METMLSSQEIQWLLEQRITRLTDGKEVLIYPMGAEVYLSAALLGHKKQRYNIRADIIGKTVLVIPGYGNIGFLCAQAGAQSVTVYDKDPVTIAWIKAFKRYYHYREHNKQGKPYPTIGELLAALTHWYPSLLTMPTEKYKNRLLWLTGQPHSLRQSYIYYLLSLVRRAIQAEVQNEFELKKNITFYAGEVKQLVNNNKKQAFDTVLVPYLLGVRNGIEDEQGIVDFIEQLLKQTPAGRILVTPSHNKKEFYLVGKRYFVTTPYPKMGAIPALRAYVREEDPSWYGTQGLTVLSRRC